MASTVRRPYDTLDPQSLLRAPVDALTGIGAEALTALHALGVRTVFDLATSRTFEAAAVVADDPAAELPRFFRRFGRVPHDFVDRNASEATVDELAQMPVAALQGVGPKHEAELSGSLGVTSIGELGAWEPYRAARDVLRDAISAVDGDHVHDTLLPAVNSYPTESVQYESILLDRLLPRAGAPALTPVADAGPLDLADPSLASVSLRPAVGAILTFTQTWYPRALALGQLLHSVALAPGETTRIALVDWSHASMATTGEEISEGEALSSTVVRSRSISEVTRSVADELQTGKSTSITGGMGSSSGVSASAAVPVGGALLGVGGSGGSGFGMGAGTSWASSTGHREISAQMTQAISDRTQQAANASRNRRATLVREVSAQESEQLTTRAITNYNHMHALTVEYFEVVQLYRVVTELAKADRCLFLPVKPIDFRDPVVLDRFRTTICRAGLTDDVRRLIDAPPDRMLFRVPVRTKPWSTDLLARLRALKGEKVGEPDSERLLIPDCEVASVVWVKRDGKAVDPGRLEIVDRDGTTRVVAFKEEPGHPDRPAWWNYRCDLGERVTAVRHLRGSTPNAEAPTFLSIKLTTTPEVWVQLDVTAPIGAAEYVLFDCQPTMTTQALVAHLEENRDHYTGAIWSTAGKSAIEALLSQRTLDGAGQPSLLERVDPAPIGVSGSYLLFRYRATSSDAQWTGFLSEHGIVVGKTNEATVPIPSGGVFAEAVLGRSNSAEELDITRFWNWQDSPIPVTAPEIAALQAGTHEAPEPGQPSQLGQPILNVVNAPSLPDPSGLAAALTAVGSANMFRDMSGLAGTQGMASTALAQALTAATQSQQAAKAVESVAKSNVSAAGAKINEGAKLDDKQRAAGGSGANGAATTHEAAAFRASLPSDRGVSQVVASRPDGSMLAASGPTEFVEQVASATDSGAHAQPAPANVYYQPPGDLSGKVGLEATSRWRWRSQEEIGWTKCLETCNAMLEPFGIETGSSVTLFSEEHLGEDPATDRLHFGYVDTSRYTEQTADTVLEAIAYIVDELDAGRPVVVGVTWNTNRQDTLTDLAAKHLAITANGRLKVGGYNTNPSTDHFVVIVAYEGRPTRPTRFHLSDPATKHESVSHGWFDVEDLGDATTAKPFLVKHGSSDAGPDGRDARWSHQARYEVTEVRRSRPKKAGT